MMQNKSGIFQKEVKSYSAYTQNCQKDKKWTVELKLLAWG